MTRLPEFITFTGLDERTNIARAKLLSRHFPIEWGILLSAKRQGADPRYPGWEFVDGIKRSTYPMRLSAHMCGDLADQIVQTGSSTHRLYFFSRVQVNHVSPLIEPIYKYGLRERVRAIAQTRDAAFPEGYQISWLFDQSGGTGTAPASWPPHPGGQDLVGYAGGIGPDNVLQVIEAIGSTGPYWIDMESGVRTDNWLDLDKCEAVCRAVYAVRP